MIPGHIGLAHATSVEAAGIMGFVEAADPAVESRYGPFCRVRCVIGRYGDEVDIAEAVRLAVERIGPVEEGLQLAADIIIIDGRGKDDDVRFLDLLDEVVGIILDRTVEQAVAGHAAFTIADIPACQAEDFHVMTGFDGAAAGFAGQLFRIAVRTQAGREDKDFF